MRLKCAYTHMPIHVSLYKVNNAVQNTHAYNAHIHVATQ